MSQEMKRAVEAQQRVQVTQEAAARAVEERAAAFRQAHDAGHSWREIGAHVDPPMSGVRVEAASLSAEQRRERRKRQQ